MLSLRGAYAPFKRPSRARRPALESMEGRTAAAVFMIPGPTLALEDLSGPVSPGLFPQRPIQPAIMPDPDYPAMAPPGGPLTGKPTTAPLPPAPPPPTRYPIPSGGGLLGGLIPGALAGSGLVPLYRR
jgi:hypothetical protein